MNGTAHKRNKPSNDLRKSTRTASEEDYNSLAIVVVSAIARKEKDVYLRFPYFAVFPEDWPRGILVKKDGLHNIFKVKTFKLANYLNKHGYLAQDAKGVVKMMRSVSNLTGEIERMLANPESSVYNSSSEIKENVDG